MLKKLHAAQVLPAGVLNPPVKNAFIAEGVHVREVMQGIENHCSRYAGFYVLPTNDIKDPLQALKVYRTKDAVRT
ncbi:MAG: hypothetical protein M0Q23_09305 [Syntrophales bacterium]|nr:hypothetical protein [Syntrophales bacterium]MCK9528817.1 hypothetical protein [Syntrophales bacterium]MDX9921983.1 hypothetical protein [Syntrophales bacterium]